MSTIKLALVQTDLLWENPKGNFKKFDVLLQNLDMDTEIVILPEVFSTGFTMEVNHLEKPVGNSALNWLKKKANSLNKIIIGSILLEEKQKYFNRMYWIRPDGSYSYYDKRHLFQMGGEHKVMTAGNKRIIIPYKDTHFMLQICYDLRFPVWVKNRFDKQNNTHEYDVLIYISNWPEIRKEAYMTLLKARAIENQAYVVWVNRIGVDNKEINHSGDSQVLDPQGTIIKQMPKNKEGILYATIDLKKIRKIRNDFKIGLDWDAFKV